MVRNPVCRTKVHRISLKKQDVDMFVFISKNPAPIIPYLDELKGMGYEMSFQVTINPYGKELEPNVPPNDFVVRLVCEMSDVLGKDRIMWRYDPVVFNERFDLEFHRENFERLASGLQGKVSRCMFSFLDAYDKHAPLFQSGRLREVTDPERKMFVETVAPLAKDHGILLSQCCAGNGCSEYGLVRRGCMDAESLKSWGVPYDAEPSGIRKGCGCVKSLDIGTYDTCMHDCLYCYANRADGTGRGKRIYDPEAEMLTGRVLPEDAVEESGGRKSARLSDFL